MNKLVAILSVLLAGLVVTTSGAGAQKKEVVRVYRLKSDRFPIEVISRDTSMNHWLLENTEVAVVNILGLLDLTEAPFGELILRWKPGSAQGVFSFPRMLQIESRMPRMEIDFSGADRSQMVAIQRTLLIALLQAHIWQGAESTYAKMIPDPPLWLSEGVLWESLGYGHDAWRGVVDKASLAGVVPSLAEIQSWDELSELRLERLWQQAFSYCLVHKTFQTRAEKRAVMLWLKDYQQQSANDFWENSAGVESWWQEAAAQPMRKKIPLRDWDQSVAALNQLRHFSVRLANGERKMFFIRDLPEGVVLDRKDASLVEYIQSFDLLALSCHYVLAPALARYRNALERWLKQDYEDYRKLIEEAKTWEDWSVKRKQNATDMLDWSVVNLDVRANTSRSELLTDYAAIVRELEQERMRVRREFQKEIFK
ncbi:MAG: hypothetical protein AAF649_04820 [Verrucomicrobiota bacterium]